MSINFLPGYTHKKLLTYCIGIVSVVLFLLFYFATSSPSGKISPQSTIRVTGVVRVSVSPQPSISAQSHELVWQTFTSSLFSLSYPPTWKKEIIRYSNSEQDVIFRQSTTQYPRLTIVTASVQDIVPSLLIQKYTYEGYLSQPAKIEGIQGIQFSNVADRSQIPGMQHLPPIHEKVFIVQKGNNYFALSYGYEGQTQNQQLEDFFTSVLQTFHFNE